MENRKAIKCTACKKDISTKTGAMLPIKVKGNNIYSCSDNCFYDLYADYLVGRISNDKIIEKPEGCEIEFLTLEQCDDIYDEMNSKYRE